MTTYKPTPTEEEIRQFINAAGADQPDVVERFLDRYPGAIDKVCQLGYFTGSALHRATERNDANMVRLLLERKANVNVATPGGATPLMGAIHCRNSEIVDTLLRHQADANAADHLGRTALMLAGYYGELWIAKRLMDHAADIDQKDNDGKTAQQYAEDRIKDYPLKPESEFSDHRKFIELMQEKAAEKDRRTAFWLSLHVDDLKKHSKKPRIRFTP